ncbi:hypothetical protein VP01_4216g1 [Puccinia sorghi]|uniref:Uncharacterized protein n=1 Tax=Puccinia sorghi TaxID=27349 RepID=A0A0L6UQN9_9BASI|nr:hypothetical protein VP01_4216g1 [Puccinia sorghi]
MCEYLVYRGLCCLRKTTISPLRMVTDEAKNKLKQAFNIHKSIVAPIICHSNLEMEEDVHVNWPSNRLDPSQLTLKVLNKTLNSVPSFKFTPKMLLLTAETEVNHNYPSRLCVSYPSASNFGGANLVFPSTYSNAPENSTELMDVYLVTCCNFNSLQSLCVPSQYPQHSMKNICFQLGAAHTVEKISKRLGIVSDCDKPAFSGS